MRPKIRYCYGWVFVRPRRWLFWRMVWNTHPIWYPQRRYGRWRMPNIHWWVGYKTIFRLFDWLHWSGWRIFCTWEDGWLKHEPLISRIMHRIGQGTAGFAVCGGECFHCGSLDGDPVELADDETGSTFILKEVWTCSTPDGTDHRFNGITICPKCGFRRYYEGGSL